MMIFPMIPLLIMIPLCIGLLYLIIVFKSKNYIVEILLVALLFFINLRVMLPLGGEGNVAVTNNYDILFVVDNTLSMNAIDCNSGTRLEQAKKDAKFIAEELNGARFSVAVMKTRVNIGNNTYKTSYSILPYTRDINLVISTIDSMDVPNQYIAYGSNLNDSYETIETSFKHSSEQEDRVRVIFFLSDGEITTGDKLNSFSGLKNYISGGAVLGYGTSEGSKIKVIDNYTGKESYLIDNTTYIGSAISKIDESNLKKIAKDLGVDYIHVKGDYDVRDITYKLKTGIQAKITGKDKSKYNDTYYFLLIPLFGLLIYLFFDLKRGVK